MKNPLEQFYEVDERIDGVYIKVNRGKDSVDIGMCLAALDQAMVMNFEKDRFVDVVSRSRGVFEKIGPLFEYYDPELEKYLQVAIYPTKASLKVSSRLSVIGKKPTEKLLYYYLGRKGIKSGIKGDQIISIVKNLIFDNFIEIAETTMPVNGLDAQVQMNVKIDPDFKPQQRKNGSVDYRDIQTFASVAKGEVLATKVPPTQGKPGISVTGEEIPAVPGNDLPLPNGKNTEITADGRSLVSQKTGIAYFEHGLINVVELLHVAGDVDFSVGNVKYTGDVLINGNVLPGFTVEADGDIHIKGDVESAKIISRGGKVTIEKGVIGKKDTNISAKSGIHFSFAQEANINTGGELTFEKYMLHCNCVCEYLEASGTNANIIGGEIKAEKSVVIRQIGSDKGVISRVCLFDKNKTAVEEKIKELALLDARLNTELEPVERQLRTKAALIKKAGDEITDRHREEIKKWVDAHNQLNQKIKYVREKAEELKAELKNPKTYNGYIQVLGNVYPGTELDLYGTKMQVNALLVNKRFLFCENSVKTEG